MPLVTPNKGEKQSSFISRCMTNEQSKKDFPDQSQRTAVCFNQFTKSKESKDWHLLEFNAPITENAVVDNEFTIKGIAINETTTHNNHKYIAEELEKAAPGLINKPLLKDHENTIDSIVGRVKDAGFDATNKNIQFEAKINNTPQGKHVQELIKAGDLNTVSIGAFAEDLVQEEDGDAIIARGINIVELSVVAVPADNGATFASAMASNFELKESINAELDVRGYKEMKDKQVEEKSESKIEEKTSSGSIEINSGLQEENSKLLEELESLKKEKRKDLIESYTKLCEEKGIESKDISEMTNETIIALSEQLSKMTVKTEEKVEKAETKAEIVETEELAEEHQSLVVEGNNAWIMPNVKRITELHNKISVRNYGS